MIRALVVEDSPTARGLLVEILRTDPGIEVAGTAANGAEAVELARHLRPNVITMDIRMPVMDGFEATRIIMAETPTPIVIITASVDIREVELSMQALRLGALTVLQKPSAPSSSDFEEHSRRLLQTVRTMSEVKVVRRRLETRPHRPAPARVLPRVVAVATSTGGPAALARVLGNLSADFALPILIVQHMADGFVPGFAAWLNSVSSVRVKVAEEGEPLLPRTAYVAPEHRHLGVTRKPAVSLSDAPPVNGFRPSGTFLFESVANAFGKAAVAVVMTGMGQDGVAGLSAVRSSGGLILAQNEETSVVFGMPGAARSAGLVDEALGLGEIAARIEELAAGKGQTP